jgi:hypothetical protein
MDFNLLSTFDFDSSFVVNSDFENNLKINLYSNPSPFSTFEIGA